MAKTPKFSRETRRRADLRVPASAAIDLGVITTVAKQEVALQVALQAAPSVESFEAPYEARSVARTNMLSTISAMAINQTAAPIQYNVHSNR